MSPSCSSPSREMSALHTGQAISGIRNSLHKVMTGPKRYRIPVILTSLAAVLVMFHSALAGQPDLESLKRRYYLALETDRPAVLVRIRDLGTEDALRFTVNLLSYPDVRVRLEAVESLKGWGERGYGAIFQGMDNSEVGWMCESIFVELGPEAVPYLVEMLRDSSDQNRAKAIYLLGMMGDPLAIEPLTRSLKDPSREVRIQAIQALADLGDESALGQMLELFEAGDVGLRDFVLTAAERFGWRAAEVLEASLRSRSERVRSGAAMALGRIRMPGSIPHLERALEDPSPMVRRNVTRALGNFEREDVQSSLLKAMADPDQEVQEYASNALARYGGEIVPFLLDHLKADDPLVRKNAVSSLRKIGDRRAVVPVIKMLDDPDAGVRLFAVSALVEFRDPRAIRPLIHRLEKEDKIHWLVSFAFMEIGKDAVKELLEATGSQEFCSVRNLIILRMGDSAIDVLHDRALNGSGNIRLNAISMLGELRRPESIGILSEILKDPRDGWVAAHSLARMGERAWAVLLEDCRREGPERKNALGGLSSIDDAEGLPFLLDLLAEEDPEVRRAGSTPLVKAGARAVPLVVQRMTDLPETSFLDAAEILCRISVEEATGPISSALFPEPWASEALEGDRLYEFRRIYARRGALEEIRMRLKEEVSGSTGGGTWQRIAP